MRNYQFYRVGGATQPQILSNRGVHTQGVVKNMGGRVPPRTPDEVQNCILTNFALHAKTKILGLSGTPPPPYKIILGLRWTPL